MSTLNSFLLANIGSRMFGNAGWPILTRRSELSVAITYLDQKSVTHSFERHHQFEVTDCTPIDFSEISELSPIECQQCRRGIGPLDQKESADFNKTNAKHIH